MASFGSWLKLFGVMGGILILLVVVGVVLSLIASTVNPTEYKSKFPATAAQKVSQPSNTQKVSSNPYANWNIETYRLKATPLDYESLARYPDSQKGKAIRLSGEITQVQESFGTYNIRLMTKKSSYGNGYSGDDVWVSYSTKGGKPLENDIVNVFGISDGTKEYRTVMGASREIPKIDAKYIETTGRS